MSMDQPVWDAKHPTQQESGEFNIEQRFGDIQHVRNLAKFKLSGDAYINGCFGSIAENKDFLNEHKYFLNEHKYSMEYRADKRVYSGKYKVVGAGGVQVFKQPVGLDAVRLKCLLEQLYSGVSQMEVPDGLTLIEYADCNSKYKADTLTYRQGFEAKEFARLKHKSFEKSIRSEEKHGAFNREKLNFLFKHMDGRFKLEQLVAEMSQMEEPDGLMLIEYADCINRYKASEHKYSVEYKSLGPAYVRKNVKVSARSVTHNPREKLFSNMPQSKGFIRLNIPFNHMDNKLKLERKLFDNTIPSKGFAILKLGTAYAKRRSGSTVLVIKSEFIKRGVGGCNLFEQYVYAVRSYEDAGLLAKYSRIKVSETVCLEEKHRAFIREELNILLKHTDNKLKLEWQASNLQQARIIAKLKLHEQMYGNKYRDVKHGLCISLKVLEIINKDFSEFKSVANLRASEILQLYNNIYAPYDQFDQGGTSGYINPTGIGGRVEEVLETIKLSLIVN